MISPRFSPLVDSPTKSPISNRKRINNLLIKLLVILIPISSLSIIGPEIANAVTTISLSDTDSLKFDIANSTKIVGTGVNTGDIVLYRNIGSFNGTTIDATVKTVSFPGGGSISNYDNQGSASTATGYQNNFQINTTGGSVQMQFDFYISGTFTVVNSGTPVILQNVRITSIDLDCSSSGGSYQYSDFTGFQGYTMTSDTNLIAQPLSGGAGARFQANKTGSRSAVPQDQVLVKYTSIQTLKVTFGNVTSGSTNYFGLVFGPWSGGGTPVEKVNVFNTPPTSTNAEQFVTTTGTTVIPLSSFGTFADVDNNAFTQVKIATLPASGKLQLSGVDVTTTTPILTTDIDSGKLKYVVTSMAANQTSTFYVYDAQDYSTSAYTLTLKPAPTSQVIDFQAPATQVPGVTIASNAISSSNLTVTLTSIATGVCTVSSLNIMTVANGTCTIVATQAGNATYSAAAPVTQSFLISSGTSQTITFAQPASQTAGATVASGATASSNLTVLLASTTPAFCSVSALDIVAIAAGTCSITASQSGNGTYAAATNVTRSFTITAASVASSAIAARTSGVGINYSSSASNKFTVILNGRVDVNGNSNGVSYQFCYSRSTSNSSGVITSNSSYAVYCINADSITASASSSSTLASTTSADAAVNSASVPVGSSTNFLSSNKDYYYQIVAWPTGSSSKVYGSIVRFKTPSTSTSNNSAYLGVSAITAAASSLTANTAVLNGSARVGKVTVSGGVTFCISTTFSISGTGQLTCDSSISGQSITSTSLSTQTATASSLTSGTKYYYQLVLTSYNSSTPGIIRYANIVSFVTASDNPVATTGSATNITAATAQLNGSIVAYGSATDAKFCWGTSSPTTSCSPVTASPTSVSSTGASQISLAITGLTAGTTYYYRAVASRGASNYFGSVMTFTPSSPIATTLGATSIALSSGSSWAATLNGYMNPLGATSEAFFCYSTSATLDSAGKLGCASLVAASPSTSLNAIAETLTVTTFTANTTYYYQLVARNQAAPTAINYGEVYSFITSAAPTISTDTATSVAATTTTLKGTVTANGASTTSTFCLATNSTIDPDSGILQSCIRTVSGGSATSGSSVAISNALTGLTPATTYYFQAIADNVRGTSFGIVRSFTTSVLPIATTYSASSIGSTTATLNGYASANGGTTTSVYFCISQDPTVDVNGLLTCSNTYTMSTSISTDTTTAKAVTSLTQNTVYYYQIYATNSLGTTYGLVSSFLPGGATITTSAVETITATSAVLKGVANKQSDTGVSAYLCISTSNMIDISGSLTCNIQESSAISITTSGSVIVSFTTTVTLSSGTNYYVQASVDGARGSNYGSIVSFKTNPVVTFNANGGSGTMASQNVVAGANITLASNSYTRSRFNFAGWGTTADTTTATYANSAVFALNSSITLYAIWTSTGYIVTFNANGGSGSMATQTATTATNLSTNSFARTNYTFAGWSTTVTGTSAYANSASYPFTEDITLYAVWTANNNEVVFIANGGTGTMAKQSASTTTALNANTFTRTNYTFSGWSTTSTGSVTYANSANFNFASAASTNLYAIWTSTDKIVKFRNSGGSGTMDDQLSSNAANLTANAYTKDGYTFKGWSISAVSQVVTYTNSQSYDFAADKTLYAVWGGSVTYDANGGVGSAPTDSGIYIDEDTATVKSGSSLTKSGFSFVGWNTNAMDVTSAYSAASTVKMFGNLTLYAIYGATVTYGSTNSTGGSVPVDSSVYANNAVATILGGGTLVRTDYTFDGWSDGTTTYKTDQQINITGSLTLQPVWSTSTKAWTATYHANGPSGVADTVKSGRTSTTFAVLANPFTYTGYNFVTWRDNASCDGSDPDVTSYDLGNLIQVDIDPTVFEVWACWSVAPETKSSGSGSSGGVITLGGTTTTNTASKLPIFTGTVVNIVPPKTIQLNKIVPVTQLIRLVTPEVMKVQTILVNGISTPTSTNAAGEVKVNAIIGPKDKVTVMVTDAAGDKIEAQVALVLEKYALANVNFAVGSAKLTDAAKSIIKQAATVIKQHGFTEIDLAGHTDKTGGTTYNNQKLSENRSTSVSDYLKQQLKGTPVKVITSGNAYANPVASSSNATDLALNRRVEIVVK